MKSSHISDSFIYGARFSSTEIAAIFSDENRVQKWLDVEKALAQTQAELGIIPPRAAIEIARNAFVSNFDLETLGRESSEKGHFLIPLITGLERLCEAHLGEFVHFGITTQDVVDTGMVIQMKEALAIFERDLQEILRLLCSLAEKHRDTIMVGRTMGQHALPTTLGFKVAVWIDEFLRHLDRFGEMKSRVLVGNITGAVGTLSALTSQGFEVQRGTLEKLGLGVPTICWHSSRDRIFEIAYVLTQISLSAGKIAKEFINLQRTEIDEIREGFKKGKIGSSTMPHKRNPTLSDSVSALSRLIRSSLTSISDCVMQEHERDGASWRIEWAALPEIFVYCGALLTQIIELLKNIEIRKEQMQANLEPSKGLLLSERLMFVLAEKVGKQTAHEIIYDVAMLCKQSGKQFQDALINDSRINPHINAVEIRDLLNPWSYLGLAPLCVDSVLEKAGFFSFSPNVNKETL